jgi:hypothetical protein
VHPVRAGEKRNINPVVDETQGSGLPGLFPEISGLGQQRAVRRFLVAQLDDASSAGQDRIQPFPIRAAPGQPLTGNRIDINLISKNHHPVSMIHPIFFHHNIFFFSRTKSASNQLNAGHCLLKYLQF